MLPILRPLTSSRSLPPNTKRSFERLERAGRGAPRGRWPRSSGTTSRPCVAGRSGLAELRAALDEAAQNRASATCSPEPRPSVYWRKDCPLCRASVAVRKKGSVPFSRCGMADVRMGELAAPRPP